MSTIEELEHVELKRCAELLGAVTMELHQEHWWDARELVHGLHLAFPDGAPVAVVGEEFANRAGKEPS